MLSGNVLQETARELWIIYTRSARLATAKSAEMVYVAIFRETSAKGFAQEDRRRDHTRVYEISGKWLAIVTYSLLKCGLRCLHGTASRATPCGAVPRASLVT